MSNEVTVAETGKQLQPVNVENLLTQAVDKGLDVEQMERLLTMRRELKAEHARERYFESLSAFQSECPTIPKTKEVYVKGQLRYRYAPLDSIIAAVKNLLKEHGFSYTVETEQTDTSVTAICRLHHNEGHSEETRFTVPIQKDSYMSEPQKVASALTYAKRYAFCDATGIMTSDEDDDANSAHNEQKKEPTPANRQPSKPQSAGNSSAPKRAPQQQQPTAKEDLASIPAETLEGSQLQHAVAEDIQRAKALFPKAQVEFYRQQARDAQALEDKAEKTKAFRELLVELRKEIALKEKAEAPQREQHGSDGVEEYKAKEPDAQAELEVF